MIISHFLNFHDNFVCFTNSQQSQGVTHIGLVASPANWEWDMRRNHGTSERDEVWILLEMLSLVTLNSRWQVVKCLCHCCLPREASCCILRNTCQSPSHAGWTQTACPVSSPRHSGVLFQEVISQAVPSPPSLPLYLLPEQTLLLSCCQEGWGDFYKCVWKKSNLSGNACVSLCPRKGLWFRCQIKTQVDRRVCTQGSVIDQQGCDAVSYGAWWGFN